MAAQEASKDNAPIRVWEQINKNKSVRLTLLDFEPVIGASILVLRDETRLQGNIDEGKGEFTTRTWNCAIYENQSEAESMIDLDTAEEMANAILQWVKEKREEESNEQARCPGQA